MTEDEASKLARELQAQMRVAMEQSPTPKTALAFIPALNLCDYILSGDIKRDIENAAFERAAELFEPENSVIAKQIRALIQPPAQQKENGE